jgi:hypothetical protein
MIDNAEEIERQQWDDFEAKFRRLHEESLAYRFLPETEEERAIVVKWFPPLAIEGKLGSLSLDCQQLHFPGWKTPIEYREITKCELNNKVLQIHFQREGKQKQQLKLGSFGKRQQEAIDAINRYLGRYRSAVAYQAQKQAEQISSSPSPA